ncbi:MAG TPA: GrpB family protein [Thermomicrobiales bacterium]|jgi:GrpB-like predicted nucleotidyltransferase (UPF0157 family)|nr:GrpB family protein [Thermomicrobiales bacterium]
MTSEQRHAVKASGDVAGYRDRDRRDDEIIAARVDGMAEHNRTIHLAEYDPDWPRRYDRLAGMIRAALGDRVRLLEHVGSTSVPGLIAKPRIDIILAVPDSSDEDAYLPDLVAAGFRLTIREPDWFEHRVVTRADEDTNVHIFTEGCSELDDMIRFRDWLRANDADRELYAATKRELGARTWRYVQHYADAKGEVVAQIKARARANLDG